MEKVMLQTFDEIIEENTINDFAKEEIKSLVKVSKSFRAIQIMKMHIKEIPYKSTKRIIDICAGIVGMIFLIPILIVVKIAYLVNGDKTPILLRQERIGKKGKIIEIIKIRSMVPNAEVVLEKLMKENPEIRREYRKNKKLEHDPRITPIGAFIRRTSLDEFGQFVEVFTGKMSLIGPRPYLLNEKEDMGEYYYDVIQEKPGLTGLWQARGRSNVGFQNRCKLDRFYNQHKGIWFDIKIVFWTVFSVLQNKGAK